MKCQEKFWPTSSRGTDLKKKKDTTSRSCNSQWMWRENIHVGPWKIFTWASSQWGWGIHYYSYKKPSKRNQKNWCGCKHHIYWPEDIPDICWEKETGRYGKSFFGRNYRKIYVVAVSLWGKIVFIISMVMDEILWHCCNLM